ncbi:MAG: insulinase family protein [Oligoflexia bacterium]|nr:insulinase family protein [Oligoflexia bacterium]
MTKTLPYFLLGTSIFLFSFLSYAKTEKVTETPLPNGLIVHEYKMQNGMRLLFVPERSAPVFTYQVWFRVGSATEKMDPKLKKTGLAHLFEHMMFRGTPKVPDGKFDTILSEAGATGLNATTWNDRTNYFESLPKESLDLVFRLESDRMANLVINEKLFKTELGAVIGEYKMNEDKPSRVAYRELYDLAFTVHPYKYTTLGTLEELNSFTVEEARFFYKKYYAPNNATLILLGDFEIPQAIKLAEKYYGKMKSQEIPEHVPPTEPAQEKLRTKEQIHPLAQTDLIMTGYHIPNINHQDIPALEVAASILAYGNGSYYEENLVQAGIASSASCYTAKSRYPSLFVTSVQLATGQDTKKALSVIEEGVNFVRKGKFSSTELERAKNQYLLYTYSELLSLSSIGSTLGESLMSSGSYTRDFEILEAIKAITKEQVVEAANKYFVDKNKNLLTLKPKAK